MMQIGITLLLIAITSCSSTGAKFGSAGYSGHGASSVDAATLAKYAAPPLPPEIRRKVQAMLDLRSPGSGMIDATGRRLFFGWSVTGTSQVWRLDGPNTFPVQLTGGEDHTFIKGVTPDGKWLILSRDRNGEENPGLYRQSAEGGALKVIQHLPGIQSDLQWVSSDSRAIYFRSNDIKADSYAIYRFDLQTWEKELVYAGEGNWYVDDLDEPRGKILLGKSVSNVASEHFELDLKTKTMLPVIGQGEVEEYSIQFSARAGEYFVLTPKIGEFRRLFRLNRGKLTPIPMAMKADVADFQLDRQRRRLYAQVNDRGYGKILAFDARTLIPLYLPKFPGAEQVVLGTISADGRRIAINVETATAPRTSVIFDWETGKSTQWAVPSTPELSTKNFVGSTLESYPARDGAKIPMFVLRPKQCLNQSCPVVVHFHGGPEGQSTPGFWALSQAFVEEGFVFVEPNVRGSDGYGKTWLHVDDGPKRLNVVTDIEDCAKFIRANWFKDGKPAKVGVMGWSYGGYSTLMAMTRFAGAYDAGVAMVGMSNLITFLENTAPYRRALRTPEYGDPAKDRDALVELSPMTYLNQVKAPLLIIQGASDPRVPAGEAVQIKKAMDAKGIAAELILFADEGHGATKRVNRVAEMGHLLRFFSQHLR